MCPRSGEKTLRRSSTRRTIAKSVSKIGTPSAIIGARSETAVVAFCEVPTSAVAARMYPRK